MPARPLRLFEPQSMQDKLERIAIMDPDGTHVAGPGREML